LGIYLRLLREIFDGLIYPWWNGERQLPALRERGFLEGVLLYEVVVTQEGKAGAYLLAWRQGKIAKGEWGENSLA